MKITFTRNPKQPDKGCTDTWLAEAEGLQRKGCGPTTDQALVSLVGANLRAFGITEMVTKDPGNPVETLREFVWRDKDDMVGRE